MQTKFKSSPITLAEVIVFNPSWGNYPSTTLNGLDHDASIIPSQGNCPKKTIYLNLRTPTLNKLYALCSLLIEVTMLPSKYHTNRVSMSSIEELNKRP